MSNPKIPKALIIDDDRVVANTLARIFSQAGYEARPAYNAEQALEESFGDDWCADLAIIDVILPDMNGIDLAILLKSKCPECRVLLFSGQTSTDELLDRAFSQGHAFDVLAKPVHPTELLDRASLLLLSEEENKRASAVLRPAC